LKIKTGIIVIFLILFITTVIVLIFSGNKIFTLKYIDIKKDFDLNEEKLIEYLGLYPVKPLWAYNINEIKERLSKQFYLSGYEVNVKYPNSMTIKLYIKKPFFKIAAGSGKIYVTDQEGFIFREYENKDDNIPLVLFKQNSKIKSGIKIGGIYQNMIDELNDLKNNNIQVFDSISQIEVLNNKKYGLDYIVKFKTYDAEVYLKNKIDVDSIIRGLACVLFVNKKEYSYNRLYYSENGFALR
jgi:hypothetical protein